MKISLPIAGIMLGVWLLPVTGYSAENTKSAIPSSASDTPERIKPNPTGTTKLRRSDHPVDDSVITTKVKGKFLKSKQIRADNIDIKTVNGVVELSGTAKNRANSRHAASLARQVAGVKSVKNDIAIAPREPVAAGDPTYKDRSASYSKSGTGSDQPVSDTWITTKVKAKLAENKEVKGHNISVKTVNGVVQLSGFAGSADEASKAASLAGDIKGVKSVNNDIKVK